MFQDSKIEYEAYLCQSFSDCFGYISTELMEIPSNTMIQTSSGNHRGSLKFDFPWMIQKIRNKNHTHRRIMLSH